MAAVATIPDVEEMSAGVVSIPQGPRRWRAAAGRLAGCACLGLLLALTGCGQGAAPPVVDTTAPSAVNSSGLLAVNSSAATGPSLARPADSGCSDGQTGRYTTGLFTVAPVTTVTYSDGLQADLYQPADDPATCRPAVVWVHGGGFTQFSRNGPAEKAWGTALASRGFVVTAVDYRLGSGEPFGLDQATDPDRAQVVSNAIADVTTAVSWLRAEASQRRVDPQRLAVGGTSAGAMAALGTALTATPRDRPCAVVSVSGDLDPSWVGSAPMPALFIHGDADMLVPYQSAVDALQILTQEGGRADLVMIAGAGHEITGVPSTEIIDDVAPWLGQTMAANCS